MNAFLRLRLMLLGYLIALFSCSAIASETHIFLGYESYDYRETLQAPAKSEEVGGFPVFGASYTTAVGGKNRGFEFKLIGELTTEVQTEYRGTELLTQTPITDTDDHQFYLLGSELIFSDHDAFSFIVGAHFRSWNRKLNYGTGYRELYQWLYLPVGIKYIVSEAADFKMAMQLSVRPMIWGNIDIIFSETVVNGDNSSMTLGNRTGYRLDFPLSFQLEATQLTMTPFYEYSEIGASNSTYNNTDTGSGPLGEIIEPASKTHRLGLLLGITL